MIRLLYFLFLFFFIFLLPAVGSGGKLPRAAISAVHHAQQLMAEEKYPDAARILQEYLAKNPQKDFVTVLFTLANIYSIMDKPARAEPLYRRVLKKDPVFSPGWQNLGSILFDLKKYKQAGKAFVQAWETSEKEGENKPDSLLYHAAIAYLMADKPALARPHLEYLVSGKDKDREIKQEWVEALLRTYLDLKKNNLALNLIRKLIHRDSINPKWWYYLAHLHLQSGKYEKVAEALTIYSYLKEPSQKEKILLGDIFQMIGIPGKAADAYREAIARGGGTTKKHGSYYEKLANAYIAAHQPELALQAIDKAIAKKEKEKLFFLKGHILMTEERWQEAYSAFARAAEIDRDDGRNHLLAGYCALQAGNHTSAKTHLKQATTFKKQKDQALQLLNHIEQLTVIQ
jgi:tetratricopeptide (TPR) repeat protein